MSKLYNANGIEIFNDGGKTNAIASISIEYGRVSGASYCFARIPRYTIDGKRIKAKAALTSEDGSLTGGKVSALTFAKRENAIFTVNASLFNMTTVVPIGQTIIHGVVLTDDDPKVSFTDEISELECYPLCIDENGDLSSNYAQCPDTSQMIADGVVYAITAWGELINNFVKYDVGKFNEVCNKNKLIPIQVIGQYQNGDYFVFTSDGARGSWKNEPGTTYDNVADFLISKGVQYAYLLDGGGSTETVIGNRQINPIYEETAGRSVPTVIYFEVVED